MVKVSIPLVITLILVLLKIFGVITCSWLWVFCLLWLPFAICFAGLMLVTLLGGLFAMFLITISIIFHD